MRLSKELKNSGSTVTEHITPPKSKFEKKFARQALYDLATYYDDALFVDLVTTSSTRKSKKK